MGRVFQAAATIRSVVSGDLVEKAAEAGLRSLFIGLETPNPLDLREQHKPEQVCDRYEAAIRRLHDLGVTVKESVAGKVRHLAYAGGWKKIEALWDLVVRLHQVPRFVPLLEGVLAGHGRALAHTLSALRPGWVHRHRPC